MRHPSMNKLAVWLAAACLASAGASTLRADEVLRHIQQSLRDQGFYYGAIDGSPGDETTQAIRRYQIRNGLAVTGQLNDETRQSIERAEGSFAKGGGAPSDNATPPPLATPPPAPQLRPPPRPATPPPPDTDDDDSRPAPHGPPPFAAPAEAPRGQIAPSPDLTALFAGTPYEFAPPPVQSSVLRQAQATLLRDGFYAGAPDGVPGAQTAEALSNLQQVSHVRATGRLDERTLAILHLLPRGPGAPPRSYGPMPGPGGVYEGRIVR